MFLTIPVVTEDRSQNVEDISKAVRSLPREDRLGILAVPEGKNKNPDPGPESSESSRDEIRFVVGVGSHRASKHFGVIIGVQI